MIIQLLTHYSKSILKSLINQLVIFQDAILSQYVENFIVKQLKNSTHKILMLSRVEKMVWVLLFLRDAAGFFKITL